jgi:hypothetical protein
VRLFDEVMRWREKRRKNFPEDPEQSLALCFSCGASLRRAPGFSTGVALAGSVPFVTVLEALSTSFTDRREFSLDGSPSSAAMPKSPALNAGSTPKM